MRRLKICINKTKELVNEQTYGKQGRSTTVQDKSGKCLTKEEETNRWTEYCSEIYVRERYYDNAVLHGEDIQLILREKVEAAVSALKKRKSAGVDNIPAELVQAGAATMTDVLKKKAVTRSGEQENVQPFELSH